MNFWQTLSTKGLNSNPYIAILSSLLHLIVATLQLGHGGRAQVATIIKDISPSHQGCAVNKGTEWFAMSLHPGTSLSQGDRTYVVGQAKEPTP